MAQNVGGVSCLIVDVDYQAPKPESETWRVAGMDGYGIQNLGGGDAPFAIRAQNIDTEANINTWFASLEALQCTVISAESGPGNARSYSSLIVRQVRRTARMACLYGGNPRVWGVATLSGVVDS